jgi:hypothetical protein
MVERAPGLALTTPILQAELTNSKLCWSLSLRHPSDRPEGFTWGWNLNLNGFWVTIDPLENYRDY